MTDYQSPGWMGSFASTIGWTWVVIKTTNLMHWLLGWLHWAIPSFGVGIILLTVLVRTILFPLSRKQAIMSLKMQELAPEIKKLKDKFKDDHAALTREQMALFKKNGVNPFGSCWVILMQMPIFMGLYFALQESITFRLAPFWPTWIENLAAPDMMINWGKGIPWISRDQDFGGFLYLGPYLNLLPIIAVALMIVQQKLMTPPAADEQQELQQKMMTYMMIFFGLMFYKVAAGLCVYFIASSLWGFAERKLLPKAKLAGVGGPAVSGPDPGAAAGAGSSTAITGQPNGERKGKGKKKGDRGKPAAKKEEEPTTWFGRLRKNFRDRLNEVLEEAKKKKPGERGS
jgi:YidC/Oxa1 family membrane protein insertase